MSFSAAPSPQFKIESSWANQKTRTNISRHPPQLWSRGRGGAGATQKLNSSPKFVPEGGGNRKQHIIMHPIISLPGKRRRKPPPKLHQAFPNFVLGGEGRGRSQQRSHEASPDFVAGGRSSSKFTVSRCRLIYSSTVCIYIYRCIIVPSIFLILFFFLIVLQDSSFPTAWIVFCRLSYCSIEIAHGVAPI
jgi:hypothetical protein